MHSCFCGESESRTWPLEATVADVDTQLRRSIANTKLLRSIEEEECVGGMARATRAVASLRGNFVIGGQVRKILHCFLCLGAVERRGCSGA